MLRHLRLASAGLALTLIIGCSARVGVRTYDPYYNDYHVWTDAEAPHYNAWIVETHHSNVDYKHLNETDRQTYWKWRHDHP
jgi:hypothetical protein